jgi:ribose transport system substrate-binding protein
MKSDKHLTSTLKATTVAVLLTLSLFITSCEKQEAAPPVPPAGKADKADRKFKIALVMKSLANEFFLTMENGAKKHQQEHNSEYELIANGIKDEKDVARQIDLIEQMIAQKVDAIVIAPADSKALVAVSKKVMDSGIVVINIDNKFDDSVLKDKGITIPFVGPDNRKGAYMAAKYLVDRLERGDQVAIIEGIPNAFNAVQRRLGFEDAINEGGLTLAVSQTANWEMDKANMVVSSIIIEHPDLKAILCANDNMALGAVAALRASGKTGKVQVVGFDNISSVQRLIKEGTILCSMDQHADLLAVYGIEYALKILKGAEKPEDYETPVDLITVESLK